MNSAAERQTFSSIASQRGQRESCPPPSTHQPLERRICVASQEWFIEQPLVDEILGPNGIRIAEWIATGAAAVVKKGLHRVVYRVKLASGTYYVKHYKVSSLRAWLQNNLRPCRAFREANANERVRNAGIATAEQVAVGRELQGLSSRDSYLITREIEEGRPFDEWLIEHSRNGERILPVPRRDLIEKLAKLTAELHRSRLFHPDYHAGNILIRVEQGEVKLWLIDLHPLTPARMTASRRWSMLGMLLSSLAPNVSQVDQLQFLRFYQRAFESSDVPEKLAHYVADDVRTRLARADRKWRRGNRRLHILDLKTVACRGIAEIGRDRLVEWRDAIASGRTLAETEFTVRHTTRPSDARQAWEMGHALSRRDFPVAAPVLFMATRSQGTLVTVGTSSATPFISWMTESKSGEGHRRVASELGRCCRQLHEAGFDPGIGAFAVQSNGTVVIDHPQLVASRWMSRWRCRSGVRRLMSSLNQSDRMEFLAGYERTATRRLGPASVGSDAQRRFVKKGFRAAAMLFAIMIFLVGCRTLDKTPPVAVLPAKHSVRADHLVLISDFRMPKDDPLVEELIELRNQVTATLKLPEPRQDVVVYLFSDEEGYRRYLESVHPGLPNRRAYFVGTKNELAVYTFWGDRIQEDLRHEYTHGILHSSLAGVPLWLDEGLAEYFEVPGTSVGGMNGDYPHQLAVSVANGWRPDVNRLEGIEEFSQLKRVDYQEAWAWVHYMLHNSPDTRQTLLGYIAELKDSPHPASLADRLATVEPSFASRFLGYVVSLNTSGNAVIRAASAEL